MPKFTLEALQKELGEKLINGELADNFAEYLADINSLEYKDKIQLATQLILADRQHSLHYAIEALRHHNESEDCFHAIISRGMALENTMIGLTDARNPHTAQDFMQELNSEHCHEFSSLTKALLNNQSQSIAERCMLTASGTQDRNQLIKQSHACFGSENELSKNLQNAAIVAHLLDLLADDTPTAMFLHEEYNPDLFHQFPELVNAQLHNAHTIAERCMMRDATPYDRSELLKKTRACFGNNSIFYSELQKSALTAHLLDLLQSENPAAMFNSEEYNPELFHAFQGLVDSRLNNEETLEAIAEKMVNLESAELSHALKKLETLSPDVMTLTVFRNLHMKISSLSVDREVQKCQEIIHSGDPQWSSSKGGMFAASHKRTTDTPSKNTETNVPNTFS